MDSECRNECCGMPADQRRACCGVESLISVDERGQTVLPKEIRQISALAINWLS